MSTVTRWFDRTVDAIARARAPREPPPAGPPIGGAFAFERPSCPVCGAARARTVAVGADEWVPIGFDAPGGHVQRERLRFSLVRCDVCAARYTTPRYRRPFRHLAHLDHPFHARARAARRGAPIGDVTAARRPYTRRAARIARLEPRPGRLLDVGVGDGFFLDVMRGRGWECVGLDLEEVVVWHTRERLGLECQAGDAESDPLPSGPFDVVTLWGSLQLMYQPQRLLQRLRSVLAPNGLLAIGVSNVKSLGALLFGEHWLGLGLPRHLVHFTPEVLTRVVTWSGYQPQELVFETPRWIISGSLDDVGFRTQARRRAAKGALYGLGLLAGRTRWGDTMEIYARAQVPVAPR